MELQLPRPSGRGQKLRTKALAKKKARHQNLWHKRSTIITNPELVKNMIEI